MARTLTMLNESGDTTISWTEDLDDQIEEIVRKKMAEGCAFFIIERDNNGVRSPLTDAADARKHRALAIPDDDLRKFVDGGATATVTPTAARRDAALQVVWDSRATARDLITGRVVRTFQLSREQKIARSQAYWERTKEHWLGAMLATVIGHRNFHVYRAAGAMPR